MTLQVGVVVPTWHYWIDPIKLQPLWELYYATLIEDHVDNVSVQIIDRRGNQDEPYPECDVYFYWVMKSADAFEVYDIVSSIRKLYPQSRHLGGGNHVDHLTEQASEHFDTVFLGTAEELIFQAFKDLRANKLEKIYRATGPYSFCAYGHSRRHFLPKERVVNDKHFSQYGGVPGTGVYFSRGCSFKCSFCVYNNPGKFEYRDGKQITDEIEYLKKNYGVEGVNLRDEVCIPVNRKVAQPYLEAIGNGGVIWRGQTVPFGDEEMVRLAAESGCQEVALGMESADSDEVLVISNKPSKSIDKNKQYVEVLKKYGIRVKVCLIFGLPGESKHVVDRTIKFLEEVEPDYVALSGFDPVPGSPFYNNPEKYGLKFIDKDLSKHAHLVYRFGDEEDVGLPFEYEETAPWGTPLTRNEIVNNIKTVQSWLRERGMSY
ncbi:radical SAM protein [Terasakiella sp. A23]|uniref:B12-binding domain-containing radical SAM protein n=1 Tax=Terasakiella sp. FCG-A23 TaxID=3080561 RepID=UPI002953C894|nr:radical SAM protein [Terasakiella sp. A23]MDV7339026.1 radical SAM protein [Terasakiella sp. A23]